MNVVLWIVQGLLALIFLVAGIQKVMRTKDQLVDQMPWVKNTPQSIVRTIGILEILGAIGLILPALTGILPWLTPLAATGLILTMIGAGMTNFRYHEYSKIGLNSVLLVMALLVMVGRFGIMPV
jgi:uncharacterized membrane protein